MKKVLDFLKKWDGLWSVPILFLVFILFDEYSRNLFGIGIASYDPGITQAIILASLFIVAANFITLMGLWFNFQDLYAYYIKQFKSDLNELLPWQRISLFVFVYAFFFSAFIFVVNLLV